MVFTFNNKFYSKLQFPTPLRPYFSMFYRFIFERSVFMAASPVVVEEEEAAARDTDSYLVRIVVDSPTLSVFIKLE